MFQTPAPTASHCHCDLFSRILCVRYVLNRPSSEAYMLLHCTFFSIHIKHNPSSSCGRMKRKRWGRSFECSLTKLHSCAIFCHMIGVFPLWIMARFFAGLYVWPFRRDQMTLCMNKFVKSYAGLVVALYDQRSCHLRWISRDFKCMSSTLNIHILPYMQRQWQFYLYSIFHYR